MYTMEKQMIISMRSFYVTRKRKSDTKRFILAFNKVIKQITAISY